MAINNYESNGVFLSKKMIREGSELEIRYNGLLAKSGAHEVLAHLGYNENWEYLNDISMETDGDGFKTIIKVETPGVLNISFRDNANNWDNNSGNNYSFKVYNKINSSDKKKKASNSSSKSNKTTQTKKTKAARIKDKE